MGTMKRWTGVAMVVSMVIATACGSGEDAQTPLAEPAADEASVSVTQMVGVALDR